jgi:ABC-type sugar transport system ATPase subunit
VPEETSEVRERSRPLLRAVGVGKAFVGNRVLDGVGLDVMPGEVHAIVGENGAGKSTLIKILGGVYQPDGGQLVVDGEARRFRSPREALSAGVVVIHQELSLAPSLSAEENIFLGRFPRKAFGVDRGLMRARTRQVFEQLGITVAPQDIVATLSIAQQQMVEIAKAISVDARILVLDEPTAVLDENRVDVLFATIERLRANGIGIVFISHHLEEIFRIADNVTVLRDGRVTGFAKVAEIDQEWLVARMIGRSFVAHEPHARRVRQPALSIKNLSVPGEVSDITLTVSEGEIVGLAGLVGAGRTELARSVIGLSGPVSGSIEVFGRTVRIRSPNAAARLGIAYVTEDRKAQGLLPNRSVRENATIANLRRFARWGILRLGVEARYARDMVKRLDVRLASPGVEIRTLSGGNQQKVLIGRALAIEPRILLLDEPTRGVDIGAKQEIYAAIERLVADGMAVMLISSDLEEVLRLSDRIVVLRRGRVAATLSRAEASEAAIMRAAALAA